MILEFTDDRFDVSNGLVVVDFYSLSCPPCRALAPILENVSNNNPDITFAKVDTSDNYNVSSFYAIRSIPTILFFKNGEIAKKLVGFQSEAQLMKVIADLRK